MKLHLKRTLTFWWKDVEVRGIMYSKLQCSFEMYTVEQLEFQNIHNESIAVLKLNARTKLQTIIVIKEGKNLLKRENLIFESKTLEKLLLLQYAINNRHYQKLFITSTQLLDMRVYSSEETVNIFRRRRSVNVHLSSPVVQQFVRLLMIYTTVVDLY